MIINPRHCSITMKQKWAIISLYNLTLDTWPTWCKTLWTTAAHCLRCPQADDANARTVWRYDKWSRVAKDQSHQGWQDEAGDCVRVSVGLFQLHVHEQMLHMLLVVGSHQWSCVKNTKWKTSSTSKQLCQTTSKQSESDNFTSKSA